MRYPVNLTLMTPLLALALAAAVGAGPTRPEQQAGSASTAQGTTVVGQQLVGIWTLNRSLSMMPSSPAGGPRGGRPGGSGGQGRGGPPGGGGFGGEMGGPPGGGMGGGRRDGGRSDPAGSPGGGMGGAKTVKIVVIDNDVRIISAEGNVRVITPNGQAVERQRGFQTVMETARWDTDQLVVSSASEGGPTTSETFALADDGSGRLVHTLRMPPRPDGGELGTITWVYDPAKATKE